MGAGKGPWGSRGSLGLQNGCGSAGPVHSVTLHPAEGSVPSAEGEGEEPALEMISSLSHSPHISLGQISVGSKQGPWDPEVPSSPATCGACRQALIWRRVPALWGVRALVSPDGTYRSQKEQILLCRHSLLLKVKSSAHLSGTGTPVTGPDLDMSHPSISRQCSRHPCGLVLGW